MPRPIYSDEIQEIMGKIPGWVVRWGISVVFAAFMMLLGVAYFFKYPKVVMAPIELTTSNPPVDLIARSTGKIAYLLVENNQRVNRGDIIAVLFNTADYRSVLQLEILVQDSLFRLEIGVDCLTANLGHVGELQPYYSTLEKTCKSYDHYIKTGAIPQQKQQIERQIKMLHASVETQQKQLTIVQKDLTYEQGSLKRDSVLFQAQALTQADYEASRQKLLQKELAVTAQQNALISTQTSMLNLEKQLTDLTLQSDNELNEFLLQFDEQRTQLLAQIKQWKETYLLSAPVEGKITFTRYWAENQNLKVGDRLAAIIPDDSTQIIGRMLIPSSGLGKVKIGQQVNVKLNGFPYMEYGLLKGRLSSISSVPETLDPEQSGYMAEVVFPNGMVSSYKNEFRFIQQMDGTAEIITRDTRLIERFVQPVESLFKNN